METFKSVEADARHWAGRVSRDYRMILSEEGEEKAREVETIVLRHATPYLHPHL